MRAVFLLLVSVAVASAQLTVQMRTSKDTFVVYEAIPITISIRNYSGRTIQLENTGQTQWLKFMVTGEQNQLVPSTGQIVAGDAVLVPPGETVSRVVDLLPFFDLRSRGTYQVRASVTDGGMVASSPPLNFAIIEGRELWTQTVGLPNPDGKPDEYRVYSLVARRNQDKDLLFIGVRAEPSHAVYSLIPLGHFLSTTKPQVKTDQAANLHVLFQNGPRSYGYMEVDPSAKILMRAAYADFISEPNLNDTEGTVAVVGGEQTYPRPERILTEAELNPPPPPPKPKPKTHWWWPFASKQQPGTGQ